jgi:SPP1 family predicted phage head-tail adaptor
MQLLRETVSVQSNTPTRSARGAEVDAWTTLATVRADVAPLDGREYYAAQQVNSEITYKVRMRYISGVTSGSRVVWGSEVLEVVGPPITPRARRRELVLMCRQVND